MIKNGGRIKLNNNESISSISDLFPWILEFKEMCGCINTEKSMASLTELMQFYGRNVSDSINECYMRPLRAAKLKDSINETLILFLHIYRDLSEDRDRPSYLNNMSNLLALYIDMELMLSTKCKEDYDKICARLTSSLYIYLEHSIEHLLDTLLKVQFMCRSYHHILDPVITKIVKNLPTHPGSTIMYIRYFFVYCLWRKINENAAVRNEITTAAISSLGPLPLTFSPSILEHVLPKVPKNQPNSTKVLLQHKFDIKKHCEMFVQYCSGSNGSTGENDLPKASVDSLAHAQPEDIANKNVERVDNNVNSIISDKTKQNESISLLKTFKTLNLEERNSFKCLNTFSNNISTKLVSTKKMKSNKNCSNRRKYKKSDEIILIDLTSDIVREECIRKRKSRKVPWLNEAKKRINSKTLKLSRKIKQKKVMKKQQEKVGDTSTSKSVDHQSENSLRSEEEIIGEKNESDTCRMVVENGNNEMQIEEVSIACTEDIRNSIVTKVNTNEIKIKASTANSETVLTEIETKQVAKVSDTVTNDNCLNKNGILKGETIFLLQTNSNLYVTDTQSDEKENDRCNKQTVIKQLRETDVFSEPEARERYESYTKVCDLKTERPSVNNTIVFTECDSKDNNVNSNRSDPKLINDEVIKRITPSELNVAPDEKASGEGTSNVCFDKTIYKSEYSNDSEVKRVETAQTDHASETVFTSRNSVQQSCLNCEQQQSCVSVENSITVFESQLESKSLDCTNGLRNGQFKEINNYNENIEENKSSSAYIRESIFESYSTDKKDISNMFKATCPNIENNENSCYDTNLKKAVNDTIDEKCDNNFDEYIDKENIPREIDAESRPLSEVTKERNNLYDEEKNSCNVAGNKYIVKDSDLHDNIDGLSLLAIVSQRVPHLKPESEGKCDQIKVKDYTTLKYAYYNQTADDEADTNDSTNTVSQLLKNPTPEIINRIVGIYPDTNYLDKVTLHVEMPPNNAENVNDYSEVLSHPETMSLNYDADTLSHNLAPIENNAQNMKENTNVILNGETIVLLQKTPNSNLYIINKAVENSKDNEEEAMKKNWMPPSEECGQLEVVASLDNISYNLELTPCNKESYQESKCSVGRGGKGIKVEPEDATFSDAKAYTKKVVPLSSDMHSQIYQDVNALSKPIDKRKGSKSSLSYRTNIKQEFSNIPNHIPTNCAIPGCNRVHSHSHEVDVQHPLHIATTHPTSLPSIYGNCTGNADLCVSYHKHCTPVSCSLQINATNPLHSRGKSASPCGRSHCLNCTYDIVAHCRQCIHPPPTDTHVSCIESNPYFLPTHSSVQSPTVQEHDRANSDTVIRNLYDDQLLLHKIEKNLLQGNSLEKIDAQCETEVFNKDAENKLPLKKRLKAHAMAYKEVPIKCKKIENYPAVPMASIASLEMPIKYKNMDNYPAVPMMSIASLEALDNSTQKRQIVQSDYEISLARKEESRDVGGYHCGSSLVRRDYHKDMEHSTGSYQKEHPRNIERQFRSVNDQSNDTACHESCLQRTIKTSVQNKEINLSVNVLERFELESREQEGTYKKIKKTQTPLQQRRSSKRNVPKKNYNYTDVDPEWNPSGESKRKRKKTSR